MTNLRSIENYNAINRRDSEFPIPFRLRTGASRMPLKLTFTALGMTAAMLLGTAHAADVSDNASDQTRAVMDLGIARGGDKVVGAHFFIGGNSSIHAGDAYYGDVGLLHNFQDSNWSIKVTAGYSFAAIPGYGGDFSFKRFPLEGLAIYNLDRQHFGIGISYHLNPRLYSNGQSQDVHYNNAAGLLLQYQYRIFGVRYTYIRYKASSVPGNPTLDASSLGLFVSIGF
jgi:hypothetical protein